MGENHRTVPLALIKFFKIEDFNAHIFIYIENCYKIKSLLKFLTTVSILYIKQENFIILNPIYYIMFY